VAGVLKSRDKMDRKLRTRNEIMRLNAEIITHCTYVSIYLLDWFSINESLF
jgi:hypothetical protein